MGSGKRVWGEGKCRVCKVIGELRGVESGMWGVDSGEFGVRRGEREERIGERAEEKESL